MNSKSDDTTLDAVIQRYREIISFADQDQETFLAALEAVTAAWNQYTPVPPAVYRLGVFTLRSRELIVVDAYGSTNHAVRVMAAQNGTWVAFVGAEAGIHVALFANHESAAPTYPQTAYDLIRQKEWLQIGSVPIDTVTCAIADLDTYRALDVEKTSYQIAGTSTNFCFSNSANADDSYPVFTAAQELVASKPKTISWNSGKGNLTPETGQIHSGFFTRIENCLGEETVKGVTMGLPLWRKREETSCPITASNFLQTTKRVNIGPAEARVNSCGCILCKNRHNQKEVRFHRRS